MKHERSVPSGPIEFPKELKQEIEDVKNALTSPVLREILTDVTAINRELSTGRRTAKEATTVVHALDAQLMGKGLMHSYMVVTGQVVRYSGVAEAVSNLEVLLPPGADAPKLPIEDLRMACHGFVVETNAEGG